MSKGISNTSGSQLSPYTVSPNYIYNLLNNMTEQGITKSTLEEAIRITKLLQAQQLEKQRLQDEYTAKLQRNEQPHLLRDAARDMQKKHSVTVGNVTVDEEQIEMAKHFYNQVHDKKIPVKQSVIDKMIGVDRSQPQENTRTRQWYEPNETHPILQDKPIPKEST